MYSSFNPIGSDLFSRGGGGGGGVGKAQIEMKLCMRHYRHKACLMQNLSLVAFLFMEI